MKSLSKAVALASLVSAGLLTTQVASAEVSASADIASAYLWRGQSLSNGEGVISGSLDYSHDSGFYAGAWTSSGDVASGTETDLYVGYYGEVGALEYDVSYASYFYPGEDDIDEIAEISLALTYDMYSFSLAKNTDTDANGDYLFAQLGVEMGQFAFTLGDISGSEDNFFATDYTYVDLAFAYNDALTFTLSQVVNQDVDDAYDDGGQLVVSYSLPIE